MSIPIICAMTAPPSPHIARCRPLKFAPTSAPILADCSRSPTRSVSAAYVTGMVAVELAVEKAITNASLPAQEFTGTHPGTEADADEVIRYLDREREQHAAQEKIPKRLKGSNAFRSHDARDNAEDGKRHQRDDPVQNLDQRFQEEFDEMAYRSKRPFTFLAQAIPKATAMKITPITFPSSLSGPSRLLGTFFKKGDKRIGRLRRFLVRSRRRESRPLSRLNHIGNGQADKDRDERIQ